MQLGLGSCIRAGRDRGRRAAGRVLRRLPHRFCHNLLGHVMQLCTPSYRRLRDELRGREWLLAGCNVRQEHSADGTVLLSIDCVVRNPTGCGRQGGDVTATLRLDEVPLECSAPLDLRAGVDEWTETLQVIKKSCSMKH